MNDIKLVCFDLDGTLIAENSWYKLNTALGVTPEEDRAMYDQYSKGELSYEAWVRALAEIYRKHGKAKRDLIESVLAQYVLVDGAKDLVEYLKGKGYAVALISGSFNILLDNVAKELGIEHSIANTKLVFGADDMLMDIESSGEERLAKVEHLKRICQDLGIDVRQCVCVGDGGNDLDIFALTGKGITLEDSSDAIKSAAWKVVPTLRDIKNIL